MLSKTSPAFVALPIKSTERKKLTPEDRLTHCEQWRDSGLSMSEYCRRHHLSVSSLSQWLTRLSKHDSSRTALVPTPVVSQPPLHVLEKQSVDIILPSGIRLSFPTIIDSASFVKLIKALEEVCK